MKTFFAYVVIIILVQFAIVASPLIARILILLLFWLSDKVRNPLCFFLGGVAGSIIAVATAFFVFEWIVGPDSFGWGAFLAVTILLAISINRSYSTTLGLERIQSEMPVSLESTAPTILGLKSLASGELVGIIVAGLFFR